MKDKKIKCLLFDLDGTLTDTISDITYSLNTALSEAGFPIHTEAEVKTYINNGTARLVERAMPEYFTKAQFDSVFEKYVETYNKNLLRNTHPYDGIVELLSKLKSEGYLLGLVTNKADFHAKNVVKRFFDGIFDYVCGNGEGLPLKPSAEAVERALEMLGAEKEETVFVGDSKVDVATAKNGGVTCIGVLWGFGGEKSFVDASPDYTVSAPEEIYSLIKE